MSIQLEGGDKPIDVVLSKNSGTDLRDWKTRLLDWVFAQGSIAIVLIAWLGWTIYSGVQVDKNRIEAAQKRMEWEQKLWDKIDGRLTELADSYTKSLEKVISASDRKMERDEVRFDKIIDRLKVPL